MAKVVNHQVFSVNGKLYQTTSKLSKEGVNYFFFVEVASNYSYNKHMRRNVYSYHPVEPIKFFKETEERLSLLKDEGKLVYEGMDWTIFDSPAVQETDVLDLPITK